MGRRRAVIILLLLFCGAFGLRAQEIPIRSDSLKVNPPTPELSHANEDYMLLPPMVPGRFETKEERAARINEFVANSVMLSTGTELAKFATPEIPKEWRPAVMVFALAAQFFLRPSFVIPYGYMPMDNPSNPFALAKIPGMAPIEMKYGPDAFPQAIKAEYNPKTGKYEQVMVDWKEFQANMSFNFGNYYGNKAAPRIPVTETERRMMGR